MRMCNFFFCNFFLFTIVIVIVIFLFVIIFMESQKDKPVLLATLKAGDYERFGIGEEIGCGVSVSLGVLVSVRIRYVGMVRYLVHVFRLPEASQIKGDMVLELQCMIECPSGEISGKVAFTDDDYLLVAYYQGGVSVVDVRQQKHLGHAFEPSARKLEDLACSGSMLAVSFQQPACVQLFQRTASTCPSWIMLRSVGVDQLLKNPTGICFSKTGDTLAVADNVLKLVRVFCTATGKFIKDLNAHPSFGVPLGVRNYEDGWAILLSSVPKPGMSMLFCDDDDGDDEVKKMRTQFVWEDFTLDIFCYHHMVFFCSKQTAIQVYHTPAGAAMASMSEPRVAWMCAVVRAVLRT